MRADGRELAAIFAGGCVGALARAGLVEAFPVQRGHWTWVTLLVNLAGTLALGFFVTRLQERLPPSVYRRPLLGTGFCGALTTFSTMQLELVRMPAGLAMAYASASIAAGFAAVVVTTHLARWSG